MNPVAVAVVIAIAVVILRSRESGERDQEKNREQQCDSGGTRLPQCVVGWRFTMLYFCGFCDCHKRPLESASR
jgi:hypothetical protein